MYIMAEVMSYAEVVTKNEEGYPEQKSWSTIRMSVLVEKIKKDKRDPWGPVHSLESLRNCETLSSLTRKVGKFGRVRLMENEIYPARENYLEAHDAPPERIGLFGVR